MLHQLNNRDAAEREREREKLTSQCGGVVRRLQWWTTVGTAAATDAALHLLVAFAVRHLLTCTTHVLTPLLHYYDLYSIVFLSLYHGKINSYSKVITLGILLLLALLLLLHRVQKKIKANDFWSVTFTNIDIISWFLKQYNHRSIVYLRILP